MGTDVYLGWDDMTEDEKKARYTGFSINAGNVGYLRASIGMYLENTVLRMVFPPEYWRGDGAPYDFNEIGFEELSIIGSRYLANVMFGIPLEEDEDVMEQTRRGEMIMKMLSGTGASIEGGTAKPSLRGAVMWLNALFDFYVLGIKKAKEGKNPTVYISW